MARTKRGVAYKHYWGGTKEEARKWADRLENLIILIITSVCIFYTVLTQRTSAHILMNILIELIE